MNLLFYVPQMAPYGGIERHVCRLAAAAAAHGHTVRFLTTSNSLGQELRQLLDHPLIELLELPRPRGSAGPLRKAVWLLNQVRRARRVRWDAIYTNGQSGFARLVWFAARPGTRVAHHHHNAGDAAERATWSPAFLHVLRRAPLLIGCSRATSRAMNQAAGRTDASFMPYLAACPVDAALITNRPQGRPLRFGFCGRLIPEKGIEAIFALAADPGLADVEWHIYGEGEAFPADRFAGRPRLVYHGSYRTAREHANALLGLDAAVLFSTHNEGMPLGLIEAMSAGLPWIATDRGGTRELAISPPDSLVTKPAPSARELATDVRRLADRILAGATSRKRQRAAYDGLFSPPAVTRLWLEYFRG